MVEVNQKMDKSNVLIILGFLLIVGAGVGYFLLGDKVGGIGSYNKISCEVALSNPLLLDVKIDSYDCNKIGSCYFKSKASVVSIVGDEGYIKLIMDDGSFTKEKYDITETQTNTYELTICTESTTGKINVYSNSNEIIDTEVISI